MPQLPVPADGRLLADWAGWTLDVECRDCRWIVHKAVDRLDPRHGRLPVMDLPRRLRCERCGGRPSRVLLVDEPRGFSYGKVQKFLVGGGAVTPLPGEGR